MNDSKTKKTGLALWMRIAIPLLIVGSAAIIYVQTRPSDLPPANSLMLIAPYRYEGTWVFDDARAGLRREPFVSGIPKMIDKLVEDIPNAKNGFRLYFSAAPFEGYTHKLVWRRSGKSGGNWYYSEAFEAEGWLCPALFKYFEDPPKEIYFKAEKK
ncbi:MAG: DUF6717 family protein [Planctomycetota bacterium]